jgi:transcription antitermination factor NusG
MSGSWVVVHTEHWMLNTPRHRKESPAEFIFGRAGLECYLPRTKRRLNNGVVKPWPLFPGYCFVRWTDQWWTIAWSIGVVRLLRAGEGPAKLDQHIIEKIKRAEVGGFVRLPKPPGPKLPPKPTRNSKVRVLTGSFFNHIGLYQGQSAHEREIVLLNLLGRMVPVELGENDRLEVVSSR